MQSDAQHHPGSLEETIVVGPERWGGGGDASSASTPHAKVEMVAGSTPELANETRQLLQVRLAAAATVLLIAVALFYVRGFFIADAPVRDIHALVTVILGLTVTGMWMAPPVSLMKLRIAEVSLFALTSILLGAYEYKLVLLKAEEGNPVFELAAVKSCVLYFFGVIMLYGTFIPNTWKRAACVLVPISLVPGIVAIMLRLRSGAVQDLSRYVTNFEQVSDNIMMLWLGTAAAVYGTHIINTLRQEAFKARQLGQYRLKKLIGAGGMGEVYLAEHQLLKRPCAIKLIHPGSQTDPQALARFEREVRMTAKLSHWNTIDIFDYGSTDDGTFYYVMEYLPGLSLADLVKHYGPMPPSRVVHLLRQTCEALREAHGIGLIHRDIKPANIFSAKRGGIHDVAKLLDFGLVKPTREPLSVDLTQEGTLSGSPLYMSPEQAGAAEDSDVRSDIYSLGATAYFLLTGHTPFEGKNPLQIMIAHVRDPVRPPSQLRPEIPSDLEQVVLRCLEKDPEKRFADVASLEKALAECASVGRWTDDDAARWWHETGGALEKATH